MLAGGDKIRVKTKKTKFKKNDEVESKKDKDKKEKHHDKTFYRLAKQEERDSYEL